MSKIAFSENLKYLRLKNNLSQAQLAKEIGITRQALSKYELGVSDPNLYTLIKISNYFNCSIDSLVFDSVTLNRNDLNLDLDCFEKEIESIQKTSALLESKLNSFKNSITNLKISSKNEFSKEISSIIIDLQKYKNTNDDIEYRDVSILGSVSAGNPCYIFSDIIDTVPIPKNSLSDNKEYYILNIKGDSMNKLFTPGEPILIEYTHQILNNDIVIALVDSDEATIKKVTFDDNYITLIPMSTNNIHKSKTYNIKDVCIQGKVVGKLSDILNTSL